MGSGEFIHAFRFGRNSIGLTAEAERDRPMHAAILEITAKMASRLTGRTGKGPGFPLPEDCWPRRVHLLALSDGSRAQVGARTWAGPATERGRREETGIAG